MEEPNDISMEDLDRLKIEETEADVTKEEVRKPEVRLWKTFLTTLIFLVWGQIDTYSNHRDS